MQVQKLQAWRENAFPVMGIETEHKQGLVQQVLWRENAFPVMGIETRKRDYG